MPNAPATPTSTPSAAPSDEERELLQRSVRGFLSEHWPVEKAVAHGSDRGVARRVWQGLAAQGLLSLGQRPEEGGLREALLVQRELGRAACALPLGEVVLLNLLLRSAAEGSEAAAWLQAVHAGRVMPCLALIGDGADGGRITLSPQGLSGCVDFVEAAPVATHLVVLLGAERALVVIDLAAPGVTVTPARALGSDGQARVTLDAAAAQRLPLPMPDLGDTVAAWRLLLAARAWGAADRAFGLVVEYVQQRRQFGQPVGRFQAVQHKLADGLIALTGVRRLLDHAAAQFDAGQPNWRAFAAALWAHAADALRRVSLETHHVFGAVGYAEAHEAPRHFRRVHLDLVRLGGASAARAELGAAWLGAGPHAFPEYDLGEAGNALRRELRAWLAEHWPPGRRAAYEAADTTHRDHDAAFARALGRTGWLGLTWPRAFGGLERSAFEMLAFIEETERAGAPRAGAPIQAAAWMIHGTPAQQARYLPELLRGEVTYGMWYSEPDSGSDLASIRTTAVRDGDHWVINGQKIWTTTFWADYLWLAARTRADAQPPHAGISMFVVKADTPGITRRPMRTMYDGEFCNTFFDDVRVPADALVGELHGGWKVLTGSLGIERAYVGSRILMQLAQQFEDLCALLRTPQADGRVPGDDVRVRDGVGALAAQIEIGRQLALNSIEVLARGVEPTWEAAMAKVFAGELMERFGEAALDLLGPLATLSAGSPGAPLHGQLEQRLRHSLMWVISIGTNEIQRSLIAQRGLGLPR